MNIQAKITLLLIVIVSVTLVPMQAMAQEDTLQVQTNTDMPNWMPKKGYKKKVRHIYFPELNFYYDIDRKLYIYMLAGQWQIGEELPDSLSKLDLANATKIQLEDETDSPHKQNAAHVVASKKSEY
jgi:hypothetical protein